MVVRVRRVAAPLLVLLAVLLATAGCGKGPADAPPKVMVAVGGDKIALQPTQYCLDGQWHRYQVRPPVVEVAPDSRITFTVPDDVAARGWSVQVWDEKLEQKLGDVDVEKGKAVYSGITSSDVVPPTFYLVVVENKISACKDLSGAWPVGFIRAGANAPASPTTMLPSSAPAMP